MRIVPASGKPLFCSIRVWDDFHVQDPQHV